MLACLQLFLRDTEAVNARVMKMKSFRYHIMKVCIYIHTYTCMHICIYHATLLKLIIYVYINTYI